MNHGNSRMQKRKQTKHKNKFRRIRRIIQFICILLVLNIAEFAAIFMAGQLMVDKKVIDQLQHPNSANSTQEYVRIDDMPDYVWKPFIAIEDHRFMSHFGVDPTGFTRALWGNVKAWEFVEGGSTITMQLARNLFLTQDKTIIRKLKEMVIAVNLEFEYSKEEILEMYVNDVYFGHGKFGIEQAANFYFGKTVRTGDLKKETITLSEVAMLAGLLKAPEHYSPKKYPEKARQRQEVVLLRMSELGMISDAEMKTAIQKGLSSAS